MVAARWCPAARHELARQTTSNQNPPTRPQPPGGFFFAGRDGELRSRHGDEQGNRHVAANRGRRPGRHGHGGAAVHRAARHASLVPARLARRQRAIGRAEVPRRRAVAAARAAAAPRSPSWSSQEAQPGKAHRSSCSRRWTPRWPAKSRRPSRRAGHVVVSNSRNHRMAPDVPLLMPEINSDHIALLERAARRARLVRRASSRTRTARRCSSRWRSRRCASSA